MHTQRQARLDSVLRCGLFKLRWQCFGCVCDRSFGRTKKWFVYYKMLLKHENINKSFTVKLPTVSVDPDSDLPSTDFENVRSLKLSCSPSPITFTVFEG